MKLQKENGDVCPWEAGQCQGRTDPPHSFRFPRGRWPLSGGWGDWTGPLRASAPTFPLLPTSGLSLRSVYISPPSPNSQGSSSLPQVSWAQIRGLARACVPKHSVKAHKLGWLLIRAASTPLNLSSRPALTPCHMLSHRSAHWVFHKPTPFHLTLPKVSPPFSYSGKYPR